MSKMHFPPELAEPARANHPDKPEMGDDEDIVDYLGRCADQWTTSPPPAPEGFELVPCEANPRHWPEYRLVDEDFYPAPCARCVYDDLRADRDRLACKAQHRRWKSWRVLGWLGSKGYALGVIAGHGVTYGRCEHCGIGRQYGAVRWRGKRPYVLGVSRDSWACLRRGHRRRELVFGRGICTVCLPCPECGSTDVEHYSCEEAER